MPEAEVICAEIHSLLSPLPIFRDPDQVPFDNGLYFFYEASEKSDHGPDGRIVRVGNHPRSQGRLKDRLWDHYSPNKNFSVFRKFLGGALLRQEDPNHPCLSPGPGRGHWERQDAQKCPRCQPMEDRVTELLRRTLAFRCVEVGDQDSRNDVEKKLIGSLSRCQACQPSPRWLGQYAHRDKVRSSGLWNSNHVGGPDEMSRGDLRVLRELVSLTLARLQRVGDGRRR